jgi:hypothetical protein
VISNHFANRLQQALSHISPLVPACGWKRVARLDPDNALIGINKSGFYNRRLDGRQVYLRLDPAVVVRGQQRSPARGNSPQPDILNG